MKKLVVILGLIATVTLSLSAAPKRQTQPGVSGKIVDSATQLPEPYVTYSIASTDAPKDAAPLKMTITDENGAFTEPLPDGEYIISFTSLGKKDLARTIIINGQNVDLGTIEMEDDTEALTEATVTALRPLVKMEVDKMTYNIEDDVDSKSMTMLDMLRKVPMVTVDAQDNIQVNGSSSFKVYVDGKPNVMLSANPSKIFKMMPASAFKSAEVITNPGAKYDAEGVGGVLNLITDKSSGQKAIQDGYNATITGETDTHGDLSGGLFLTGQKGKFSFSADINLMYQRMNGISVVSDLTNLDASGNPTSNLNTSIGVDQSAPGLSSDITASYEIDSLRLVTATFGAMDFRTKEAEQLAASMTDAAGAVLYGYDGDGLAKYAYKSYLAGVDYQRSFAEKEGRTLTASYLFSANPTVTDILAHYNGYAPDSHSDNGEYMTEHTAQIDYTTPFGQGHTFSAGAKFISRANRSDADYYLNAAGDWALKNEVRFNHLNSIVGAYGEYAYSREKWSAKAGLRYEHTFQDVTYESGAGTDFNLDFGNFVPSASLQYNLSDMSNVGLSYNLRIHRPGIGYLNPYVERSELWSISYGNVDLKTEKSHNFGLVWNYYSPIVMVNLTGRYSLCGNKISAYSFIDGDGVLNTTYGNVASEQSFGASAFVNVNLGSKTRIYSNMSGGYTDLSSETLGLRGGGWNFSAMTGLQQTLPRDLRLSVNHIFRTKTYQLDGWSGGLHGIMGGITKSFFEDRLSLTLNGVTGITKNGHIGVDRHQQGKDYINHQTVDVPISMVGFSVSYNFGTAHNINVKKASRSITNDDVMQKSSGATSTGL